VSRGLEDEAPDRAAFACAAREEIQSADHVHLVRTRWIHVEGVDARERVDHGVDADRADELADQGVPDVQLQVVRPAEVVARLADVDADDPRRRRDRR
jgi:hypothetical protein